MSYDLKLTLLWEHSSIRMLLMSVLEKQLQVFTAMIQIRSFLVFLRSTSQYYTVRFRSQMREIFTLSWSRIPEMSRRVPKISDEFRETSERYRKFNVRRCSGRLLSTSEETTILACLDFVRTKKDTESSCVKEQFVWICESGVGNCPWCVKLMSLVHRPKTQAWCVYNWSVVSRTRRSMQAYVPLRDFSVVTVSDHPSQPQSKADSMVT